MAEINSSKFLQGGRQSRSRYIHYPELLFHATRIISECNRACAIFRNKFKEAVLPGWEYTCHLYEKQVSGRTVSILYTAFYR